MTPPPPPATVFCAECGRPSTLDEMARFGDVLICPVCKYNYAQKLREGVMPARSMMYAGFWIRFVAALIDGIILGVVGTILQFAFVGSLVTLPRMTPGEAPTVTPEMISSLFGMIGLLSLLNMAIGACYEGFFVGKLAATPGKMALGLKVVRPDGSPVSLGRAFGRYFGKFLSSLILGIGYIMVGFDSEKRGLHDMICDTRVMKTR
jgi:uncharacterized RDD family membrane protein YckC